VDHQDSLRVERARRGDRPAFGLLIDRCRPRILLLVADALGPDEAPDWVQETFLQAFLSLDACGRSAVVRAGYTRSTQPRISTARPRPIPPSTRSPLM
jgi:hypothetical protein